MAFTSHGHHIKGSPEDSNIPRDRARCGGPGFCSECSLQASQYHIDARDKITEAIENRSQGIAYEPVSAEELHDEPTLQDELSHILNRYSSENDSGTPDFILAEFLMGCLASYNKTVQRRAQWRGESIGLFVPQPSLLPDDITEDSADAAWGPDSPSI